MSVSLFDRLRQRYPAAEICTNLLTIHNDTYVVQAVICHESAILASGLAADDRIETAEDRACQRALLHLGLAPAEKHAARASAALSGPSEEAATGVATVPASPVDHGPPPPPAPAPKAPAIPSSAPQPAPPSEAEKTAQPPATSDGIKPPAADGDAQKAPAEPSTPAPAVPDAPSETATPTDPVDLSDIIVQTDVELKRLGWGVAQGREFLERTYGKRSRHDLSDEELLEFLLYLEAQPTPG